MATNQTTNQTSKEAGDAIDKHFLEKKTSNDSSPEYTKNEGLDTRYTSS